MEHGAMKEDLPNTCKALATIPSTTEKEKILIKKSWAWWHRPKNPSSWKMMIKSSKSPSSVQ